MSGIVGNGFMGRGKDAALILDSQNAAAAYSVRKLRTAYEGPCIRVSDNPGFSGATKNVGFDSNGYLDVASLYPDSYIRTWYDQSGNGLNFVQNTTGLTPTIQLGSVLQAVNGIAALKWDGVNDRLTVLSSKASFNFLHNGQSSAIATVVHPGTGAAINATYTFLNNVNGLSERGFTFFYSNQPGVSRFNMYRVFSGNGSAGTIAVEQNNKMYGNAQQLVFMEIDADNATAANRLISQINNDGDFLTNVASASTSASDATIDMQMGRFGGGGLELLGYIQEMIIYDTDQSANKTTIQNNINNYFSIY